MRFLTIIMVLATIGVAAEDSREHLPKHTQRVLEDLDSDLEKAKEDYYKEVEKAKAKAVDDLERHQKAIVKSGDLEAALAIKAEITRVNGILVKDFLGNVVEVEKEEKLNKLAFVGKWSSDSNNEFIIFNNDHTWTSNWDSLHGVWAYEDENIKMTPTGLNKRSVRIEFLDDGKMKAVLNNGSITLMLSR